MTSTPGPWGPVADVAPRAPRARRLLRAAGVVGLVTVVGLAATGVLLYQRANDSLTRVPLDELTDPDDATADAESTDARTFVVVGSDARDDADDVEDVATGDVDGQRSDAIMYVSVSQDRDAVSVLSLPRDLLIERDGDRRRLGETFRGGADELVATVQEEYGLPVHHYAEVTFDGFIGAVDTLGGVELCLEEDLVDRDAGADLDAGCSHRSPEDALAFVRSRQGRRADLERIERQQRFVRATLEELTDRRVLTNVPRLFELVEDVAGHVTTDDRLTLRQMYGLADEVRELVDDDVPMVGVPAYPEVVAGREVLLPYGPGARAAFEQLRARGTVPDPGSGDEREATSVAIWSRHREEGTRIVASTLLFAGFADRRPAGPGPADLDVGSTTTVFARPGEDAAAARVAALLGAPVRDLPGDAELPDDVDTVVAVGRDATSPVEVRDRLPDPDESLETQRPEPDEGS